MKEKIDYISIGEAAAKWGISRRNVADLCSEGKIEEVQMVGGVWVIPTAAKAPIDAENTNFVKTHDKKIKPFLKWAGGKGQLLPEIEKYYPFHKCNITKYAEPFVGGGAVLFDILSKFDLKAVYISDINPDLINAYTVIRDNVFKLIQTLEKTQNEYILLNAENRKSYYIDKRDRFNTLKANADASNNVERAALMIFLNRTCFNGLYRVNRKGQFNVPSGVYKNPLICDKENLKALSEKLQNVTILCGDYRLSANFIDCDTFVYFDPPYRPITNTANFTAYTENEFNDEKQIELSHFIKEMDKTGAKILASNSDPCNADPNDKFFDDIYAGLYIKRVEANRFINSKGDARGKIKELLISNFKES